MFCQYCGNETEDGSRFCSVCGAALTGQAENAAQNAQQSLEGKYVTPNIVLCDDGIYRWYYDLNMLKNPSILFTVFKVLGISFGIVWLFVSSIGLIEGDGLEGFLKTTGAFAILMAVFAVIGSISYLIVAASYGGSYMVLFEMNDSEIKHIQAPKQFKKAEAIGWLTMFAGALMGSPGRVGQGMLVASKYQSTSEFGKVTKVKVRRGRNTIYVDQNLSKNQVYAYDEDFDFVREYIVSRCKGAKVR